MLPFLREGLRSGDKNLYYVSPDELAASRP